MGRGKNRKGVELWKGVRERGKAKEGDGKRILDKNMKKRIECAEKEDQEGIGRGGNGIMEGKKQK